MNLIKLIKINLKLKKAKKLVNNFYLEESLNKNPDEIKYLLENALKICEQALLVNNTHVKSHLVKADIFIALNKLNDAESIINMLLLKNPENIEALYLLSEIYFNKKSYELTITTAEKILAIDNSYIPAIDILIDTNQLLSKYEECAKYIEIAISQLKRKYGTSSHMVKLKNLQLNEYKEVLNEKTKQNNILSSE